MPQIKEVMELKEGEKIEFEKILTAYSRGKKPVEDVVNFVRTLITDAFYVGRKSR